MTAVKYCSASQNPSGYGMAARNFVTALFLAGVDVTTENVSQMAAKTNYGWSGALCQSLEKQNIDYKIKIIHLTGDLIPTYTEKGKYTISHMFWETDRIPKEWIKPLNSVNEIWTLAEPQAQMIRDSGITTPIHCFAQPIDTLWANIPVEPYQIPNFSGFTFFSVFHWIDRKNPRALLETYWKTFEGKDDVCLVIKTFRWGYSTKEFETIKREIMLWKAQLKQKHYPKVYLATQLLTTNQMLKLYKSGDVFVSTSRGEGNNIGAVESSLMGKPVIAIDQTGFADIFPKDIFYPIKCSPVQATQVPTIPWYESTMKWLEIDQKQLSKQMMECYTNRDEVKKRGKKASEWVKKNLNYFTVGKLMKDRLSEIEKFL